MSCDFFLKILTHDQQQVTSVFFQKPLVIGHIFLVSLGDSLPQSTFNSILKSRLDSFTVIVVINSLSFCSSKTNGVPFNSLGAYSFHIFSRNSRYSASIFNGKSFGVFSNCFRALNSSLFHKVTKKFVEQFLFFFYIQWIFLHLSYRSNLLK